MLDPYYIGPTNMFLSGRESLPSSSEEMYSSPSFSDSSSSLSSSISSSLIISGLASTVSHSASGASQMLVCTAVVKCKFNKFVNSSFILRMMRTWLPQIYP